MTHATSETLLTLINAHMRAYETTTGLQRELHRDRIVAIARELNRRGR